MSTRYRPIFHCAKCGTRWKGAVIKLQDGADPNADAAARLANGSAKCPNLNCGTVHVDRGINLAISRAPGIIGNNIQVKAIDETAKIVMEDYGLPDIRDDVRPHETATPKLPPIMQAQADNFFVGRGKQNSVLARKTAMMGQAAIKGAFSQQRHGAMEPVGGLHSMSPGDRDVIRPKINIVAGDGVRPPR